MSDWHVGNEKIPQYGRGDPVNDVIVPHDIPAVAVEINKSSELITEKLSRVFYTVYTDTDTLHIPVFWDVFVCKYETGRRLHNERCTEASA
mgnify:CR=1 FL=1